MSRNVLSYGCMAPLLMPLGDYREDAHEIVNNTLNQYNMELNYEGTLVFSQEKGDEHGDIVLSNPNFREDFLNKLKQIGLLVNEDLIQFYTAYWYNGSDSYMSDMTIAKFNKSLGGTDEIQVE